MLGSWISGPRRIMPMGYGISQILFFPFVQGRGPELQLGASRNTGSRVVIYILPSCFPYIFWSIVDHPSPESLGRGSIRYSAQVILTHWPFSLLS